AACSAVTYASLSARWSIASSTSFSALTARSKLLICPTSTRGGGHETCLYCLLSPRSQPMTIRDRICTTVNYPHKPRLCPLARSRSLLRFLETRDGQA